MRNSRRAGKPAGKKPEKQGLLGLFTKGKNIPTTAQQTLPYREMYRDGVCRVADRYYTKTIEYEDINYQLAQSEDQAAIFDGWSACLNYFDSSLPFQLSFLNHRSRPGSRYSVNIPMQDDDYNSVRCEYVEMLENQIAKSNNGIVRTKLLTFGVNVDDLSTARARLERVEADICGNFKKLGVKCRSLSGLERLELLHGQLHPGSGSPFRFSWDMIPKTGLSTKDFIAPDSFDFRFSRLFRVGTTWGAASYLQILASELSDKLLAELLEMDAEMTITLHIQTVDQAAAVKSIKAKVSDIDKMKVEEQKKAARSGYDMDILPPDLVTYSNDAKTLLEDLQSRNERMFLLTFLVVNMAPTRRELDNDLFTVSGIVQKYNCTLKRLDFQQEDGFLSSLPLGHNGIEIKRGMTTSSTAIFVPFMTQELRMDGEAVYYGLNALSHNVIMANRKKLKNPNGLFLGVPGSGKSFAAKRELVNVFLATRDRIIVVDPMGEYSPLIKRLGGQVIEIAPDSPHHNDPVTGGKEHVHKLPLCGKGFAGARHAEEQAVGVFELLPVCHDDVMGKSVEPVIDGFAIHAELLRHKGNENGRGAGRHAALDLNAVMAKRKAGKKTILLLEVQPLQGAVVFLDDTRYREQVVVQLPAGRGHVHYKEGQQEHSFIPALQIFQESLCVVAVRHKVGWKYVHVVP